MVYAIPKSAYAANMSFPNSTSLSSLSSSTSQNSLPSPSPSPSPPRRARSHKNPLDPSDSISLKSAKGSHYQSEVTSATGATRLPLKAIVAANPNALLTTPVPPQLKPIPFPASSASKDRPLSPYSPSNGKTSPTIDDVPQSSQGQPQAPPLSNVPRRRTSVVGRSTFSTGMHRSAGLKLDFGDLVKAGSPSSAEVDDDDRALPENSTGTRAFVPAPLTAPAAPTRPRPASQVYVRPTAKELAERQRAKEARLSASSLPAASTPTPGSSTPSFIRKKSGELVKPSLKSVSMFSPRTPSTGTTTPSAARRPAAAKGLALDLDGLPLAMGGIRSEPTTPLGPKMVHFDVKLEHVKHFLAEQKPIAVSRDGSPTETSEGGEDFFSYKRARDANAAFGYGTNSDGGRSSEDEKVRKTLSIQVTNMPSATAKGSSTTALDVLKSRWNSEHVRLEELSLAEDGRTVRGTVLVRNLAFAKTVVARFTMDGWQTTSEVSARHVAPLLSGTYDRFEFGIRLADYLGGKIWEKKLEVAVRYVVDGRTDLGEMWDNNEGKNYVVVFRRRELPVRSRQNSDDEDEDEERVRVLSRRKKEERKAINEQVGLKVAQLKRSLDKLVPSAAPVPAPSARIRFGSPHSSTSPPQQTAASSSPSFINNRSAADVLQRVGKISSPTASASAHGHGQGLLNRAYYVGANDANPPPLSPRRNREGTLAGRYDISSSLKREAAQSHSGVASPSSPFPRSYSQSSVPFPNSSPLSPSRTFPPEPFGNSPLSFPHQTFVSNPVTFNVSSLMRGANYGRGSPRDALALTPAGSPGGGNFGVGSPGRTSSDGDLPAATAALEGSPMKLPPSGRVYGQDMYRWANGVGRRTAGDSGSNDEKERSLSIDGSYFSLAPLPNENWDGTFSSPPQQASPASSAPVPIATSTGTSTPSSIVFPSSMEKKDESPFAFGLSISPRMGATFSSSPPGSRFHSYPPLDATAVHLSSAVGSSLALPSDGDINTPTPTSVEMIPSASLNSATSSSESVHTDTTTDTTITGDDTGSGAESTDSESTATSGSSSDGSAPLTIRPGGGKTRSPSSSSVSTSPTLTAGSTAVSSPMSPSEPLSLSDTDGDNWQPEEGRVSNVANGHKGWSNFLDEFCFYTGTDGLLSSRRSHSTSSFQEFISRSANGSQVGTPTETHPSQLRSSYFTPPSLSSDEVAGASGDKRSASDSVVSDSGSDGESTPVAMSRRQSPAPVEAAHHETLPSTPTTPPTLTV